MKRIITHFLLFSAGFIPAWGSLHYRGVFLREVNGSAAAPAVAVEGHSGRQSENEAIGENSLPDLPGFPEFGAAYTSETWEALRSGMEKLSRDDVRRLVAPSLKRLMEVPNRVEVARNWVLISDLLFTVSMSEPEAMKAIASSMAAAESVCQFALGFANPAAIKPASPVQRYSFDPFETGRLYRQCLENPWDMIQAPRRGNGKRQTPSALAVAYAFGFAQDFDRAAGLLENENRREEIAQTISFQISCADPRSALNLAERMRSPALFTAAVAQLERTQPGATATLTERVLKTDWLTDDAIRHIFMELPPEALEETDEWLEQLPEDRGQKLMAILLPGAAAHSPDLARAWLARIDDGPLRDEAEQEAFDRLAYGDPRNAFEFAASSLASHKLIQGHGNESFNFLNAARNWARLSPEAARGYMNNTPHPAIRKAIVEVLKERGLEDSED